MSSQSIFLFTCMRQFVLIKPQVRICTTGSGHRACHYKKKAFLPRQAAWRERCLEPSLDSPTTAYNPTPQSTPQGRQRRKTGLWIAPIYTGQIFSIPYLLEWQCFIICKMIPSAKRFVAFQV